MIYDNKDFSYLVGKTILEASESLKDTPYFISIESNNGISYVKTCDLNFHRVNVIVVDNIITAFMGLG